MKVLMSLSTLLALVSIRCGNAQAEIFSQLYAAPAWRTEIPDHYYTDVPVDLGLGVAAVDSIWIEIAGVARTGTRVLDLGGVWIPVACRDGLLASFVDEPSQGDCGDTYLPPDGVPDCIAGAHTPSGLPGEPFTTSVFLSAVEWSVNMPAFTVLTPRPELGDLFRDGVATLRIKEINGTGSYACVDGLADLSIITVNVAYRTALAVDKTNWGSLKAQYR